MNLKSIFWILTLNLFVLNVFAVKLNVEVVESGFEPKVFEVNVGDNVQITFHRKIEKTCATKVGIPALEISKELPLNQKVTLEFTPKERGSYVFGCHPDLMQAGMIIAN